MHFTADTEFRELLEEVRALASHCDGGIELLNVMKRGLLAYRNELQKKRFGVGRRPRPLARKHGHGPERRSRHIPAAVAREVYLRDDGCCTFRSADGRRRGARRFLELDHVTPWAVGGESSGRQFATPLSRPQLAFGTSLFRFNVHVHEVCGTEPSDGEENGADRARKHLMRRWNE